jgi:hypothetical protein
MNIVFLTEVGKYRRYGFTEATAQLPIGSKPLFLVDPNGQQPGRKLTKSPIWKHWTSTVDQINFARATRCASGTATEMDRVHLELQSATAPNASVARAEELHTEAQREIHISVVFRLAIGRRGMFDYCPMGAKLPDGATGLVTCDINPVAHGHVLRCGFFNEFESIEEEAMFLATAATASGHETFGERLMHDIQHAAVRQWLMI